MPIGRNGIAALPREKVSLVRIKVFLIMVNIGAVDHLRQDQPKRKDVHSLAVVGTGEDYLGSSVPSRHHLAGHGSRFLV